LQNIRWKSTSGWRTWEVGIDYKVWQPIESLGRHHWLLITPATRKLVKLSIRQLPYFRCSTKVHTQSQWSDIQRMSSETPLSI